MGVAGEGWMVRGRCAHRRAKHTHARTHALARDKHTQQPPTRTSLGMSRRRCAQAKGSSGSAAPNELPNEAGPEP